MVIKWFKARLGNEIGMWKTKGNQRIEMCENQKGSGTAEGY